MKEGLYKYFWESLKNKLLDSLKMNICGCVMCQCISVCVLREMVEREILNPNK